MIDRRFIGWTSERLSVAVETGQLRLFAKATGETNPIYFDEAAAKAAGHPAVFMTAALRPRIDRSRREY